MSHMQYYTIQVEQCVFILHVRLLEADGYIVSLQSLFHWSLKTQLVAWCMKAVTDAVYPDTPLVAWSNDDKLHA